MFKAGQKVVKVINVLGIRSGSYCWVAGPNKNKGYISVTDTKDGDPWGNPDIHAYHRETGQPYENNIPGAVSYILTLKQAKEQQIEMESE